MGCPTCEGVTQFYSIADLALDEDNRLYILDQAVRAGERIGRYFVGRDYLAGVTFDEDEVQYVSLYRVTQ